MVEEMYLEEIKDQEQNGDISHDINMIRNNNNNKNEPNKQQHGGRGDENHNITSSEANYFKRNNFMNDDDDPSQSNNNNNTQNLINNQNNNLNDHISNNSSISSSLQSTHSGFNLVRPDILTSPKKQKTNTTNIAFHRSDIDHETKHLHTTDMNIVNNTITTTTTNHHHGIGGGIFGSYPMAEIGSSRFNSELLTPRFHGNGVSLTLGLPHSDHSISVTGSQQNYISHRNLHLGRRLDITNAGSDFSDINPTPPPHSTSNTYDLVEIQSNKRFAAQLLPDFVA